jgi:hypothetical protein
MVDKLIYLATPYNGFKGTREEAYHLACLKAAELMEKGYTVFSPIAHSHSIEVESGMSKNGKFWLKQDFGILAYCDELWVYKLPGWDTSYGVAEEIKFAKSYDIPVKEIEYA